jgi:multicomponent Na+:H+ antiporter subunit D
MLGPTAVLVIATVALGVMAGPLYDYCLRAAADLVDPSTYVSVVLGKGS